ncbi:hypothetical protein ACGFIY_21465 [Micromonospora chersina]|uniref:hypothetical protein n=1 Tax=Micromonospora chersina TaxID=47854 RepID=UPI00371C8F40
MGRWRWQLNLPSEYNPPQPHVPIQPKPASDRGTVTPAAASGTEPRADNSRDR